MPPPPPPSSQPMKSTPSQPPQQFILHIHLPIPRPPDFSDPPNIVWTPAKESHLQRQIAQAAHTNEINWDSLATDLEVTRSFLLRKAAWLFQARLEQVKGELGRKGMRRGDSGRGEGASGGENMSRGNSSAGSARTRELERLRKEVLTMGPEGQGLLALLSGGTPPGAQNPHINLLAHPPPLTASRYHNSSSDEDEPAFLPPSRTASQPTRRTPSTSTLRNATRRDTTPTPSSRIPLRPQASSPVRNLSSHNNAEQQQPHLSRSNTGTHSETPSMGSSFSDLSDASISQSLLEDAYRSGIVGQSGGGQTMASRVFGVGRGLGSRVWSRDN